MLYFSNFSHHFYLFISLLLSTLISLFLYPFIFLYFLLFLFPSSYYKFTIIFSIILIVFHIQNVISLFVSLVFHIQKVIFLSHFWWIFFKKNIFSCISTLGWWILLLFGTLLWVDVIKFCVFKLLSFLFSLIL